METNRYKVCEPYTVWSKQFAERLLDSMGEGVFTLNANGCKPTWNPAMERTTGYKASEAIGESCRLLNFSKCFDQKCTGSMEQCGIYKKGILDPIAQRCRSQYRFLCSKHISKILIALFSLKKPAASKREYFGDTEKNRWICSK
ncbi:MAG: PAS domain-containing protein [Thermodesulfobacteriota bacterium]|nr:PAS domain-containing protein [Thermodesulfobacteriota bacterium]